MKKHLALSLVAIVPLLLFADETIKKTHPNKLKNWEFDKNFAICFGINPGLEQLFIEESQIEENQPAPLKFAEKTAESQPKEPPFVIQEKIADTQLKEPSFAIEGKMAEAHSEDSPFGIEEKIAETELKDPSFAVDENPRSNTRIPAPSARECIPDIQPYQVSIGHIEGKGVGYDTGYTTFEAFFAPVYSKYIPFFDAKAHVFDNGKFAANLGIGMRYVWKPEKYLFGMSGYYDYRKTKHGHYNQIGTGFEVFADRYEFRANGYLPVGAKRFGYDKELTGISFKKFQGNNILINEFYDEKVEFAMKGFNAEIGVHPIDLPMPNYDLYVGAGTYYYIGHYGKNTWGGKIRVSGKIYKYFSIEISDSFDRVFHNRFQGQVAFSYPLGNRKIRSQKKADQTTCFNDNVMYWRGSQPVQRQDPIVVNHKNHHKTMVDPIAIDPLTGKPFFVVFANNTNGNLGNGTFENPFQNLSTADNATNAQDASVAGNTIYVFAGNETSDHMSHGIILKDDQRLLGSGHSHTYQTTKGTLVIPAQTSGVPHISYPANMGVENGVVLANASEVSGFHIEIDSTTLISIGGACIRGYGLTSPLVISRGSVIRNNVLLNDTHGIHLGNEGFPVEGNFTIDNNISNFHAGLTGSQGFGIFANIANGYTLIENNICNDNISLGGSSDGIFVRPHNLAEPVRCDILNNQANSNSDFGLVVAFDVNPGAPNNGSVCVNVNGNTMNYNSIIGIQSVSSMTSPRAIPHIAIENNTSLLSDPPPGGAGIELGTLGAGAALCARVNNNSATITDAAREQPDTTDFLFNSPAGTTLYLEPLVNNEGIVRFTNPSTIAPVFPEECNCP